MNWNKITLCLLALVLQACSFSYSFQGGKLNYDMVKTITIHDFPFRLPNYPQLPQEFGKALRDRYIEQTRLVPVPNNGDIEIEGEITGWDLQGSAVKEDAYASRTKLTITVRVKYTNNKEPNSDVDQSFSASQDFDATRSIDDVQDQLVRDIVADLIDQIYNATVGNW
jgi:hypothetical protein